MTNKDKILQTIPRTRTITAKEISHQTDIGKPQVCLILNKLVRDGLVDREHTSGHGSPFEYSK